MRSAIIGLVIVGATVGVVPDAAAAPKSKPKPVAETPHGPAKHGPTNPADVIGRYNVLRGGKDTGCMLTLEPSRALLAPACRDNGIVIFDPKGWSLTQRRLVLRARKGHAATFEMDETGAWQKDGENGPKVLGFRKM